MAALSGETPRANHNPAALPPEDPSPTFKTAFGAANPQSAAPVGAPPPAPGKPFDWTLIPCLVVWYAGNYYYNIYNKLALQALGGAAGLPLLVASLQLLVGVCYAMALWVAPDARTPPRPTRGDLQSLLPVCVCFCGAHFFTVLAVSAGAVSFVQIVKASEPAFAALLGVTIYGKAVSTARWLSLIPVIAGVALSSLGELQAVPWAALSGT